MIKKKYPFAQKLLSYSALVSGMLAGSKEANSQILYTDISPDDVTTVGDTYLLDLDNDGTADFEFNLIIYTGNPGNVIRVRGNGNNAVSHDPAIDPWLSYYYARALYSGDNIGASLTFKSQVILGTHYSDGNDFGNWVGKTDRYLGLKLAVNSNTYYGWARLSIDAECASLTVSDYAVDTLANQTILAGDKCGNFAAYINTVITPAEPVIVCEGNTIAFSTDLITGYTYQWLRDNIPLAGATSFTYDASESGSYSVMITSSNGCSDTSVTTAVTIAPLPGTPEITQTDNTLSSTLAASYQWYQDGILIPGATGQTYNPTENGEYSVQITDENGCSAMSDSFTFIATGISDSDDLIASLYASNNVLFVSLRNTLLLDGQISLFNAIGQQVHSSVISDQTFQIDLNHLVKGIYLVTLNKQGETFSKKIVIQ